MTTTQEPIYPQMVGRWLRPGHLTDLQVLADTARDNVRTVDKECRSVYALGYLLESLRNQDLCGHELLAIANGVFQGVNAP